MTPEQFCYWLQGYFELNGGRPLITAEQSQIIMDHLNLVFKKETPDRSRTKAKIISEDKRKTFEEVIEEVQRTKVDPFSQPGRIC